MHGQAQRGKTYHPDFLGGGCEESGLVGETRLKWTADPMGYLSKRMLQMRARGFALRDAFADVLKGLHLREEFEDAPVFDITPLDCEPAAGPDRQHLLTEIQTALSAAFPGQNPEARKIKGDILEATFKTRLWKKVTEDVPTETLDEGEKKVHYLIDQLQTTQDQPTNAVQWLIDRLEDRRRREPQDAHE